NVEERDYYDSALIPQSTDIMPEAGARIESIQIFNDQEQQVNNLLMGREYFIRIKGIFLQDCYNIHFGYHIRSKTNMVITGGNYPNSTDFIKNIYKLQQFELTHSVKMLLLPDVYFIGSGIWTDQGAIRLH